jgi:hypothetical protein
MLAGEHCSLAGGGGEMGAVAGDCAPGAGEGLLAWAGRSGRRQAGAAGPGGLRFAFYGRVSTEDHQDPVTSRARQLAEAQSLAGRAAQQPGEEVRQRRAARPRHAEEHLHPRGPHPAPPARPAHPPDSSRTPRPRRPPHPPPRRRRGDRKHSAICAPGRSPSPTTRRPPRCRQTRPRPSRPPSAGHARAADRQKGGKSETNRPARAEARARVTFPHTRKQRDMYK